MDLPELVDGNIKILYRDRIKVFYDSVKEAHKDDYLGYEKELFPKAHGLLYGYTGLRGDAKNMYRDIMRGDEKRVELIKAPTAAD